MIARSPSAVSKPCRPPPNSSPTRAMTAKPCATGWQNAEPRPSSHRARTARSNTIMTRPSTGSATSSSACLPPQGLAPYSHPLRPQHQKLHRRNRPCRRRHLVAVMSLDPNIVVSLLRNVEENSVVAKYSITFKEKRLVLKMVNPVDDSHRELFY